MRTYLEHQLRNPKLGKKKAKKLQRIMLKIYHFERKAEDLNSKAMRLILEVSG